MPYFPPFSIFMLLLIIMISVMLAVIIQQSILLARKVKQIMATLKELNDALDAVAAGVNSLEASIADLKAQVAGGSAVTQADLDALSAKAAAIVADISDPSDQG